MASDHEGCDQAISEETRQVGGIGQRPGDYKIPWSYNPDVSTFVYLVCTEDGYFKIGCTKDVEQRLGQLAIQLPFKIERHCLLICKPGTEKEVERLLHRKFAAVRMNGEWFKLTAEDLAWLKNDPLDIPVLALHGCRPCLQCLMQRGLVIGLA